MSDLSEYERGKRDMVETVLKFAQSGADYSIRVYKLEAKASEYGSGKLSAYNDVMAFIENELLV